ncbi:ABC-type nitrate/sulfonate/bicarbonate transport system, ATPase component [Candidatus Nitrososphaera evergladensis SR1]|jgi:NitT/TauT family transport system ATP-binding protein|uniref:ABC-type nitrate/sulfonate/bicarbonate transport system, ATPase component n=1 Tax=Candidatus Nitrososphaera evergladensis SR1 TaxID=1459636 RepID=A0A075MWK6_9ARCH|nr:ABC transporter ATP-binding protein [Candidatus Nitrososphaera evergladensis]AIF85032.1 ABC-type nitrate/sulfonate/bicarbonate transport system, ATPase component [Candidatus Nitrososphaera evergladensis SR1]
MAKLEARNIGKHFNSVQGGGQSQQQVSAIDNVNLSIEDGQFVCLVGPSGCGKTTFLNILAGLDRPSEGEVVLDGKPVTETGPERVMVFQENALFPWLRVIDNVEFGLMVKGVEKAKRNGIAMQYLEMMQLTKFADAYTYQLSGGMKQRVAIARALAIDPEVLLMDEPFAALDSQTRDLLLVELQLIWARTKKTIVFITHNITESVCLGDKVAVFTKRPGTIKKEVAVDYRRPRLPEDDGLREYQRKVLDELKGEIAAKEL